MYLHISYQLRSQLDHKRPVCNKLLSIIKSSIRLGIIEMMFHSLFYHILQSTGMRILKHMSLERDNLRKHCLKIFRKENNINMIVMKEYIK